MAHDAGPPDAIDRAFLMLLWRPPARQEREETLRALEAGQSHADLAVRLLSSAEFRLLNAHVRDELSHLPRDLDALEEGLRQLGPADAFVQHAYDLVLGRAPDADGLEYYRSQLERELSRTRILRGLVLSDEFADRYRMLCPQAGRVPTDIQLCELANPAKWDNPEWRALLASLERTPTVKGLMHRKAYEFGQLLFGLSKLGSIVPSALVLSVGAGHEPVLYWLANRVGLVVGADLYSGEWQDVRAMEGDPRVLTDPAGFARFDYRAERLRFFRMDGRRLAFRGASFDVVYSLSSIEHFGSFEESRKSVDEMARVLRPGGILALATEYSLDGPDHPEVFRPEQVHRLIEHPDLQLVQPIDESVWRRYDFSAVDLRHNPYQTPHMVVQDNGTVFTSVMAFLRKRG